MQDSLIEQVKRLADMQKNCWASKWPLERVSDTSLGADTRCMVQVGVTDDGEPIGEVDGGLEPVAEGHKDVLDLLTASLGVDFPALLAHMQAQQAVVDAARSVSLYAKAMQEAMRQVRATQRRGEGAMFAAQDRAADIQVRYAAALDALDAALADINALAAKGSQ